MGATEQEMLGVDGMQGQVKCLSHTIKTLFIRLFLFCLVIYCLSPAKRSDDHLSSVVAFQKRRLYAAQLL